MHARFWSGNRKSWNHSEDVGIGGNIILEWILGEWAGNV
jgi:hypothetical protein